MAIRPDYVTGTITLTSGSTSFTTSGSALQAAAVKAGDEIITRSGNVLIIASITGQNSGTLMQPCPAAAAGAAQPLRIRYQPDGSRYQGAARDLISRWGVSGNVDALAGITGAANTMPYFTGVGTMARTPLTALARSLLDDTSGGAMWATMGGTQLLSGNGYALLPNGLIMQWGIFWTGTSGTVTFPIAFPSFCRSVIATKGSAAIQADDVYINVQVGEVSTTGFDIAGRRITTSSVVKASITTFWTALGY